MASTFRPTRDANVNCPAAGPAKDSQHYHARITRLFSDGALRKEGAPHAACPLTSVGVRRRPVSACVDWIPCVRHSIVPGRVGLDHHPIDQPELECLPLDPDVPDSALRPDLKVAAVESQPFRPSAAVNSAVVAIDAAEPALALVSLTMAAAALASCHAPEATASS